VRAFDVEIAGTVGNHGRVVDLVAEFVVEVVVVSCGAGRIDAVPVDDVQDAVGLSNRIDRQKIRKTHTSRGGVWVGAGEAHAVPSFLEAGAGRKISRVVLAEAAVDGQLAVAGKDHSQSDRCYQD
jgi:hypothetical protein